MILELKHPTRGDIGKVWITNGVVVKTEPAPATGARKDPNRVRQMKGWIENSVRLYATANNWICTTVHETTVAKPPSGMQMSDD